MLDGHGSRSIDGPASANSCPGAAYTPTRPPDSLQPCPEASWVRFNVHSIILTYIICIEYNCNVEVNRSLKFQCGRRQLTLPLEIEGLFDRYAQVANVFSALNS